MRRCVAFFAAAVSFFVLPRYLWAANQPNSLESSDPMAFNDIAERRRIRRKLSFWRVFTFLFIALAIVLLWLLATGGNLSDNKERDHIARIEISGLITDDRELLERLDRIAKKDSVKVLEPYEQVRSRFK